MIRQVVLASLAGIWSASASAQFVDGTTLFGHVAYPVRPTAAQMLNDGLSNQILLKAGVDFTAPGSYGGWTVDLHGPSVEVHFTKDWTFTVAAGADPFNGFWVADLHGAATSFGAIAVSASSTLAGFTSDRLSYGAEWFQVNLKGLSAHSGDVLILNVSSVPEPSFALLALLGLGALGAWRRR